MKCLSLVFTLFFASCMNSGFHLNEGQNIVQTMPLTKQKQRIAILQKKLEIAQRNLKNAQESVDDLNSELQQSQLTLIEKTLDTYKKDGMFAGGDFHKEKAVLYEILQDGPSPTAFEAQVVLDRMLRLSKG